MKTGILAAFGAAVMLQGCASTPEQERQAGCIGATATGAIVGGVIGNQFGGGTGKDILTAGGAVAGGLAGNAAAGC
ncbi:MAG: glycine zipper 2TM domain-containing protein [Paracoccaceae bacterium]